MVVLAACASDDMSASGAKGPSDASADDGGMRDADGGSEGCATKAEACAAVQKACVMRATGPVCVDCEEGKSARDGLACVSIEGERTEHDFAAIEVAAGFEQDGFCQSWSIGNEEEIWLNALELFNDGAYHHSNWFFVPEDEFPGADGAWECPSRGFTEPRAAVVGGVLYAQSTQSVREVQSFPEGVAIRIPPRSKIVGATHILNFRSEAISTQMRMRLYGLAAEDVTTPLTFMRLNYNDLTIPPHAQSEFFGECDMEKAQGAPMDAELYWVLPHYHALGAGFRLERFGGPDDGEVLFEIGEFNAEAQGRMFDPPIALDGAKGLRFACRYENPRDIEVGYGIGDQEMCVMLAFLRSGFFYDALVKDGARVEETSAEPRYTGPCSVLALPPPDHTGVH
jgi:hypothetical protein